MVKEKSEFAKADKKKVSIYRTGGMMGEVIKEEVYLLECGTRKYAQYNDAPYVKYIQKRKRKATGFVKGYNPYLLIVEGWDNGIDPKDAFVKCDEEIVNGITWSRSRHLSFSDDYKTEFNDVINPILESKKLKVLFDVREVD